MLFRLQSIARRNFSNVHSGNAFHAVEVNEGTEAAGAPPGRELDVADIFHAVADGHGNVLGFHPPVITGLLQAVQEFVEVVHDSHSLQSISACNFGSILQTAHMHWSSSR